MSEFSHLKNKLLAEQVEDQIYHYILDEALEPGAMLPNEFALGEKFRVGRSTIREAVKLLSSKGIVEVRQGSGTYVVTTVKGLSDPLNLRSVQDKNALAFDLVNVRLLLEPGIAEMAAQNATPEDIEARAAVRAAYAMEGPVYLRFGRLAVPVFHDEANYHFELGKGEQLTEGNDIAIIATGLMVNEARMAAEQLAAEGIHARVINIHTIKPLDEEIVLKAAKECGKVITAEEHNVIGGLGEAVCAVLSEKLPTPVRRVGVQDVFGCSGPAWDLLKKFGLDAATICKTAHEMLGK